MSGWPKRVTGLGPATEEALLEGRRLSEAVLAQRYLAVVRAGGLPARYDAAATTEDNRRHWANADAPSADAGASADERRTLRNRARCEVANNSYARGIVLTLANDTVGTGPRLQMLTGLDAVNRTVEREFEAWAPDVALAEKLRTMRMGRCQDGEAFKTMPSESACLP